MRNCWDDFSKISYMCYPLSQELCRISFSWLKDLKTQSNRVWDPKALLKRYLDVRGKDSCLGCGYTCASVFASCFVISVRFRTKLSPVSRRA